MCVLNLVWGTIKNRDGNNKGIARTSWFQSHLFDRMLHSSTFLNEWNPNALGFDSSSSIIGNDRNSLDNFGFLGDQILCLSVLCKEFLKTRPIY